jgi:hypothetical protein
MVAENAIEFEFARIAAVMTNFKVSFILFIRITKNSCYFAVVFACTVQRFTKIFFRSNIRYRELKNGFLWLYFFSNIVLKYVK